MHLASLTSSCVGNTISCNGRPIIFIFIDYHLIFGPDLYALQMPSCTSCIILLASSSSTHFSNNPSWHLLINSSITSTYFKPFCFSLYSVFDEGLLKYCFSSNLQSLFFFSNASATSTLFTSFHLVETQRLVRAVH